MRILIGPEDPSVDREAVDDDALARLYAPPRPDWWRASMVSTTDGAASGPDGVSGSINDDADGRVFAVMRAHADAVVVGAGTVRIERYGRVTKTDELAAKREREGVRPEAVAVIVSHSGHLPPGLPILADGGPPARSADRAPSRRTYGPPAR